MDPTNRDISGLHCSNNNNNNNNDGTIIFFLSYSRAQRQPWRVIPLTNAPDENRQFSSQIMFT